MTVGAKAEFLTSYLRWTFRTSFTMLLLLSAACFLLLSCAFAIAIHVVGIFQPMCIYVGGEDYNTAGHQFLDAFALSWTTLSTVVCVTSCRLTKLYLFLYTHAVTFYWLGIRPHFSESCRCRGSAVFVGEFLLYI